ncbi:MAG: peptide chain release factor N(5)-glutamine methyltransferase, partial [Rhodobacteraceae bacterium]|nr:peptide chain release factor N(5)-glutamine methyltransferase [Paracoccaceae bacterium]
MRAADALPGAVARLRAAGVEAPAGDARALLAHALGVAPGRLTLHLDDPLPAPAAARFEG